MPMMSVTTRELTANFATRKLDRMDVHVGITSANGRDDLCQVAPRDALAHRADHIGTRDEATESGARRGTRLRSSCGRGRRIAQVCAQEDADAAC